jgi:hypothetical protein
MSLVDVQRCCFKRGKIDCEVLVVGKTVVSIFQLQDWPILQTDICWQFVGLGKTDTDVVKKWVFNSGSLCTGFTVFWNFI